MSKEEDSKSAISGQEFRMNFSGPAVHVNKFYVTFFGQNARITFCEAAHPEVASQFRSAVVMSIPDFIALKDLMERLSKDIRMVEIKKDDLDG